MTLPVDDLLERAGLGVHIERPVPHGRAVNTERGYTQAWKIFTSWCTKTGRTSLPAEPETLQAFIEHQAEAGFKIGTIRGRVAGIRARHRDADMPDPGNSSRVRGALRWAARELGDKPRQVDALTSDVLDRIDETARLPRQHARGKRPESEEYALRRGNFDVALCRTIADGGLRISEIAALRWRDILDNGDGTGQAYIAKSKTDQNGRGATAWLGRKAMDALETIRPDRVDLDERVFPHHPNNLRKRIKDAARAAGLGDNFAGHSGRVGLARDLISSGAELLIVARAGRWEDPRMPARYNRLATPDLSHHLNR